MDIQRETALKYQGLFNLMANEHGLILEQTEMDEIIREAMTVVKLFDTPAVMFSEERAKVCKDKEHWVMCQIWIEESRCLKDCPLHVQT